MCGLIGVVGNITKFDISFFRQALAANVVRGWDSTGVASLTNEAKSLATSPEYVLWTHKDTLTGSEAACDKTFNAVFDDLASLALMGHNRAATIGKVTKRNAHPFSHGDLSLMHNGTLVDTSELDGNFDTDSEQIAYTLSRTDDVKAVLEKIDGAFALSWLDVGNQTFNLARNDERTLYIAYNHRRDTLYYASEEKMLEWLLHRNKLTHTGINPLPVGSWLSIDLDRVCANSPLVETSTKFTPLENLVSRYTKAYYPAYQSYCTGSSVRFNDPITFKIDSILESQYTENRTYNIEGYSEEENLYVKGYGFSEEVIRHLGVGDVVIGYAVGASYYSPEGQRVAVQKDRVLLTDEGENTIIDTYTCQYCNTKVDKVEAIDGIDVCLDCVDEVREILDDADRRDTA